MPIAQRCTFENEANLGKLAREAIARGEAGEKAFAEKMDELLRTGAVTPTDVSMSNWYYMQEHARECQFCREKFERLAADARKTRRIDGPTTLE